MKWSDLLPEETMLLADGLAERAEGLRAAGRPVYPSKADVFRALSATPPDKLKICLIGQDPYHGPRQANGLAFSVCPGTPFPPSLRNIFDEYVADTGYPMPDQGDLSPWAAQGVLLLNAVLTVPGGCPNGHAGWGWQAFTKAVADAALDLPRPVVFLLWGAQAAKFVTPAEIAAHPDKTAIVSTHPSPLSASRPTRSAPAFLGSRPFTRANGALAAMGAAPVDWRLPIRGALPGRI